MNSKGKFMISLDFELYWGVRDLLSLEHYDRHMSQEREIVPKLLALFEQHGIHSTWATVGFMFAESREELMRYVPDAKPDYAKARLSPYPYLLSGAVGNCEAEDPAHYAHDLIRLIMNTKGQRIATHTFSHYYCLEEGQTQAQFREDLKAAIAIAEQKGIRIESIVFPRNQFNSAYASTLKELGIRAYRGNPDHWIYRRGYRDDDSWVRRLFRLADAYVNISGHHCFSLKNSTSQELIDLPASHFFRPYAKRLRFLEPLRVRRILSSMTYAAKKGLTYHLWWHPYNFATNEEANMAVMRRIIDHYERLNKKYGMQSMNMEDFVSQTRQVYKKTRRLHWLRKERV